MSLGVMGTGAGGSTAHATGTYTGTGSAVTLTFDAPVQAMIIRAGTAPSTSSGNPNSICWIIGDMGFKMASGGTSPLSTVKVTRTGNSITIPPGYSKSGDTYAYIAFF